MKFERTRERESLDASIMNIAQAYGFTAPAINVSKKTIADLDDSLDIGTKVTTALVKARQPSKKPQHLWGATKRSSGTTLSFTILASRHAISHALVVKAAVSIAEAAGFTDLAVGVSSIGDSESRRRFARELGTFFRKNAEALSPEILKRANTDPEGAYRAVLADGSELIEKLPRPIDYLSESSRKTMVDTLHLFESVGIEYELQAHLPAVIGTHAELLFAVSGVDQKGERVILATGGRLDDLMKKQDKSPQGHAVGVSVTVPEALDLSPQADDAHLSCFVVHVGEAAKLKGFKLLDALCRANVSVQEALLAESLKDQMDAAKAAGAKYIAIIGQREALDGTVIIRNVGSGMQQSVSTERLTALVARSK
jgi:histidyl-tRNA synthetase